MPSLHAYVPAGPEKDATWAFDAVRGALARHDATFTPTVNPFTRATDLKVVVGGTYHLTVFFETGDASDADLTTITGRPSTGSARVRVLSAPDPDGAHTDVVVDLLTLFDSFGPVLVYGVDAEQVFTDTLTGARTDTSR